MYFLPNIHTSSLALQYCHLPCSLPNSHKTHSSVPLKPDGSLRVIGSSQPVLIPPELTRSAQGAHEEDTEGGGTDIWGWLRTHKRYLIEVGYLNQICGRVQRKIGGRHLTSRCSQMVIKSKWAGNTASVEELRSHFSQPNTSHQMMHKNRIRKTKKAGSRDKSRRYMLLQSSTVQGQTTKSFSSTTTQARHIAGYKLHKNEFGVKQNHARKKQSQNKS